MRITYFALKPLQVGDDLREPGDLVPEANDWPYLRGYVRDGQIAPVLVATLPLESQEMLAEWERDHWGITTENTVVAQEASTETSGDDKPATTTEKSTKERVSR